ncbi:ABC transporter substrate-binding protein [Dactylosporangium sp. NPDC051541]|uniref:ABC transporter substrate-binding protein n=1 Tax=Dactylosporangium sp. NPDC051541 TaxID=3363977 RepID=UPI0037996047
MEFPGVQRAAVAAATLALLAGCAGPGSGGPAADPACAPYAAYRGHEGTTITVRSSIRDVEADKLVQAWDAFESCTGITIDYTGRADFEKTLPVDAAAGHGPDVALFPQPGLLALLARAGRLKPAAKTVAESVGRNYPPDWQRYGTVDGELYGTPIDGNVKSLVWYSPKYFDEHGYTVPQTWAELTALSDRIAATGIKPWCAGIESGGSTGWPATDWLEDTLLRTAGPAVYDQWVEHRIPFDDPRVVAALDRAGGILRNPKYVNGGLGGVDSVATTAYQEAGLPILLHECALHRQASFYTSYWPANAAIDPGGDLYAFYLPPVDPAAGRPILGAGVFAGAFTDRPEVEAFSLYLSTPAFADSRARTAGIVSPNKGLDQNLLTTPIEKLEAALLADPGVTFRFDGSDQMPPAVGAGTFWSGMTDWIKGADTATVLHHIETTWPA